MCNENTGNYMRSPARTDEQSDPSNPALKPHVILPWTNNPEHFIVFEITV